MLEKSDKIDYKGIFEEIYSKHLHKVQFYAHNYIQDWDNAKSIANDVFTTIWIEHERIDFNRDILPYLFVLTKHKSLNFLKKLKNEREYISHISGQLSEMELNYQSLEKSDFSIFFSKDIYETLESAIAEMSDKVRSTFLLSRFENLKYEEIAGREGISIKTVEYRISVALRILRKKFIDYLPIVLGYLLLSLCL